MPASFSAAARRGAAARAAARAAMIAASTEAGSAAGAAARAASAEAGATLLLLLLPDGLFAGGAGEGAIGRFLAAPLAAAAAAAAGAGAGAAARATDAEVGATLLPCFFAGSLGIVPPSGGVVRPPDRRGTFDFTAIGSHAACAPASAGKRPRS